MEPTQTSDGPHALVTGAFSNIGAATAAELLRRGWRVSTLTNREPRPGDDPRIVRYPLRFDTPTLAAAMAGVDAIVNTYWIRFPHRGVTFDDAIANIARMIDAASACGVARFVQVGVSNASLDSDLGYYRGKARVDQLVRESGLAHGIVRPTLVVGPRDVLTGNIAWFLRSFPVIASPRGAGYNLQPVTITDTAHIIADAVESTDDVEVDAAGPDTLHFRTYLELLARALDRNPRLVTVPPGVMVTSLALVGRMLGDVILTSEELAGLEQDLLVSRAAPLGRESVIDWISAHPDSLGSSYTNDTRYRFRHTAT